MLETKEKNSEDERKREREREREREMGRELKWELPSSLKHDASNEIMSCTIHFLVRAYN